MSKDEVKILIEKGIPCFYKYGLWDTIGTRKSISKKEALKLLPNYDFEQGFYILIVPENKSYILFKELSETDLW